MSYSKRLASLKKQWTDSKPAVGGSLPEGKYQFVIRQAKIEEGKQDFNKGHLLIVYTLEVAVGPLKGRKAWIRVDLDSEGIPSKNVPAGMAIFKGHLDTLHIDIPSDLTEESLKNMLESLVGTVFNGQAVANKKGYINVYINSLVNSAPQEEEEVEEEEEEEEEASDEDENEDEEDEEEEEPAPPKKPAPAPAKKGGFQVTGKGKQAEAKKPAPKQAETEDDEDSDDWDEEF